MSDPRVAAKFVRERFEKQDPSPTAARVGLILGSGLGVLAERIGGPGSCSVPYSEIPGLPGSSVGGHKGRLVAGRLGGDGGTPILCMDGRLHAYEGHAPAVLVLPVRVMALLGVRTLVVTNAAGGVDPNMDPGDLMLIEDHLNFSGRNALEGPNDPELGPRFPDMSNAYDRGLRELATRVAGERKLTLRRGVYGLLGGPSYETPAEVRAMRTLGADAVGMSTVFEVTAAVHAGVRVLGLSLITNRAAGTGDGPLSHAEVLETAEAARERLVDYMEHLVPALAEASDQA